MMTHFSKISINNNRNNKNLLKILIRIPFSVISIHNNKNQINNLNKLLQLLPLMIHLLKFPHLVNLPITTITTIIIWV